MKNLAGNKDCDDSVEVELRRAGIEVVSGAKSNGEVSTIITGQLEQFTFVRAWRYWMVRGHVPLVVARELYENLIGKTDVRVVGHCDCPPPEEYAVHLDGGERFVTSYHIDSQAGLQLFADTLRKHKLV